MTNERVKEIVLTKGLFDQKENERIYYKFFHNWVKGNDYIYNRFKVNSGQKILDIGSNYGHNLIHFSSDSVGIEFEKRLADFSRALGLKVIQKNAEEGLNLNEKFDLIWCSDFLPHLVSPFKFLYELRTLLNSGGRLIIQMPLMSFWGKYISPCHFYAFNKKSLIYLLDRAGFKTVKTSGCVRRLPHWINRLLEWPLQWWGGNIWILAEKSEVKIDFTKTYLPNWFKNSN